MSRRRNLLEGRSEDLDGCALDFTKNALPDDELENLLVPEGEEEDEDE